MKAALASLALTIGLSASALAEERAPIAPAILKGENGYKAMEFLWSLMQPKSVLQAGAKYEPVYVDGIGYFVAFEGIRCDTKALTCSFYDVSRETSPDKHPVSKRVWGAYAEEVMRVFGLNDSNYVHRVQCVGGKLKVFSSRTARCDVLAR